MHYGVQSIGCHVLQQQLVKHLLNGCILISKSVCEKSVDWKLLEEKNEEKTPNFGRSYLRNGWSDFLQIWNMDSPT